MDLSVMSAVELAGEMGSRVRDERLRRNLTQRTLAERAGVSRLTVTRLESGAPVTTVNFLAVLVALNRGGDLDGVLQPPRAQTIEQFVDEARPTRQRGRR
jgi:transcriptional regulator with XRE-family HTH domain